MSMQTVDGIKMQLQKTKGATPYNQRSLLYDIPLARSVPNRPLTKNEMYLIVASQYCIQLALINRMDCLSLDFDMNMIAKARGKRVRDVSKQCQEAVNSLTKYPFAQQLFRKTKTGEYMSIGGFPMYKYIILNKDGGIHIDINEKYAEYYQDFVMTAPDLVIPYQFYMHSKSQYSYSLVNWLTSCILEMRKETHEYESKYTVSGTFKEILDVVPTPKKIVNPGSYKRWVLQPAVDDINKNPYSQIKIESYDSYSLPGSKATEGYTFTVEIFPPKDDPMFLEKPELALIDSDDTPPWDALVQYMEKLHADKGFITRMKEKGKKERLFKAILYTLMQPVSRHTGAYLNRIYKEAFLNDPIYTMCSQIDSMHNEYSDPIIRGVIDKHEEDLRKARKTVAKPAPAEETTLDLGGPSILDELRKKNPDSKIYRKLAEMDTKKAAD